MPWMVRLIPLALLSSLAALAACGGDEDDDAAATATPVTSGSGGATVAVTDNQFTPVTVTVRAGQQVTWNWNSQSSHSVVGRFNGQDVRSDVKTGSDRFVFTFSAAGTFDYQCGIHGASMPGKVIVQ